MLKGEIHLRLGSIHLKPRLKRSYGKNQTFSLKQQQQQQQQQNVIILKK